MVFHLAPVARAPGFSRWETQRRHRPLIRNWFHARGMISAGVVEGFNGKTKLTTRKAYGFCTPQGIEFALFHVMRNLPKPECTHRFC